MEKADILLLNGQVVTAKDSGEPAGGRALSKLTIIENGCVAIANKKIVAVGPIEQLKGKYFAKKIIDCSNKTIVPGFVDAHTHLVFAGSREDETVMKLEGKDYMSILKGGGGILATVTATRKASFAHLLQESKKRLAKMLTYGTTTAEIKTGYALDKNGELKCLNVIRKLQQIQPMDLVPTFLGAHALPPEFENASQYIKFVIEKMLPAVRFAKYCDIFCEKDVFSIEDARKLFRAAVRMGYQLKMHADEFTDTGGAGLAADWNVASADHLLTSSYKNIKKLARKKIVGVLLPAASFALLKEKYAPARKYIEMGLPIALGTDLSPNCYTESMQFVLNLACYKLKLTPAEAITTATLNSAYAVGMQNQIGSIEKGKKADILILDAPNYKYLAYKFGTNLVEKVIKNGSVVVSRRW